MQAELLGWLKSEVPPDAIQPRLSADRQSADSAAAGIDDRQVRRRCRRSLQQVIDGSAVGRILSGGRVVRHRIRLGGVAEAVGVARREQVRVRRQRLRRYPFQWRDVVENPEAAAVGGEHEVV